MTRSSPIIRCTAAALLTSLAACGGTTGDGGTTRGASTDASAGAPLAFRAISAGHGYTCGVDTASTTWCWGENRVGQLGAGDTLDRLVPTRIAVPFSVRAVTAGWSHSCALGDAGRLACWGDNREFALGDSLARRSLTPMPFREGDARPWTAVTLGRHVSCALDEGGEAWCWGSDHRGERGDGDGFDRPSARPRAVVDVGAFAALSAGWQHVCGLTARDSLAWCWGDGHAVGRGSLEDTDRPALVDSARRFVFLDAGESVTCAIDRDARAWCWGIDYDGQLGEGRPPRLNEFRPMPVAGEHRFTQLSAGRHRVCALDTDGAAWCWGSNYKGALGDGSLASSSTPVRVMADVRFTQLSAGDGHACALDEAGHAWCWGENVDVGGVGALGDGSRRDRSTPVRVAPPTPVTDGDAAVP